MKPDSISELTAALSAAEHTPCLSSALIGTVDLIEYYRKLKEGGYIIKNEYPTSDTPQNNMRLTSLYQLKQTD
jgi:hypothetical protein